MYLHRQTQSVLHKIDVLFCCCSATLYTIQQSLMNGKHCQVNSYRVQSLAAVFCLHTWLLLVLCLSPGQGIAMKSLVDITILDLFCTCFPSCLNFLSVFRSLLGFFLRSFSECKPLIISSMLHFKLVLHFFHQAIMEHVLVVGLSFQSKKIIVQDKKSLFKQRNICLRSFQFFFYLM